MASLELDQLLPPLSPLLAVSPHIWIDYDAEADVLYLSFRKPQQATDSQLEGEVVYHYAGDVLVGATVIGLRARLSGVADH